VRVIIEDEYLKLLFNDGYAPGKPKFNAEVEKKFIARVIQMEQANNTNDLRALKSLHFEKLSGSLEGKYSVRINQAFRIIFRVEKDGSDVRVEILFIEELSNHYS
jgi:proteic killer suppression protein